MYKLEQSSATFEFSSVVLDLSGSKRSSRCRITDAEVLVSQRKLWWWWLRTFISIVISAVPWTHLTAVTRPSWICHWCMEHNPKSIASLWSGPVLRLRRCPRQPELGSWGVKHIQNLPSLLLFIAEERKTQILKLVESS